MSLWWAKREQLDPDQVRLIESLGLEGNYFVLGPPGSGKTNVLLRRAQFVRMQGKPNIQVLTFTRALAEFLRTGCLDANGAEIFPPSLVNTLESWVRDIYRSEKVDIPDHRDFAERKLLLARGALDLVTRIRRPKLDVLFVDEVQDLIPEEVELLAARADKLFFVGDDRQKIYEGADGLQTVRSLTPAPEEQSLSFHYRLAPEICSMADRILSTGTGRTLSETCHYDGPRPARILPHQNDRSGLVAQLMQTLKTQLRAYGDRISEGDRLGVVVPRRDDRDEIANSLEADPDLQGRWQIVRSRTGDASDRDYNPALDADRPILIMTEQACKGLEFRALHWMFVDDLAHHRTDERYYTIVTRAKTSLDIYHIGALPSQIARSYAPPARSLWS
ncbi:AAA family ATPase [Agrobacterium sp. InxBP2]|uniref:AAA family ATPase n=1 Tax=Agrobacterium sp. InxBP2 TaxID=2870329 RepID=UPI00249DC27F|nr:AAA family ATPase [Agrobacterium sp. InxBP2]MCW8282628.1 AAA family ATPase [Agrobacterium sp. InxBP2]